MLTTLVGPLKKRIRKYCKDTFSFKSEPLDPFKYKPLDPEYIDRGILRDIEKLYLAMSRARVKCTVIMYPEDNFNDFFKDIKLNDSVKIVKHT